MPYWSFSILDPWRNEIWASAVKSGVRSLNLRSLNDLTEADDSRVASGTTTAERSRARSCPRTTNHGVARAAASPANNNARLIEASFPPHVGVDPLRKPDRYPRPHQWGRS